MSADAMGEFELALEQNRARAALHTRADGWRAAAVMTCFLPPVGILFGAAALLSSVGLGRAIDQGQTNVAEAKLSTSRLLVLVGTGIGAASILCSLVAMLVMWTQVSSVVSSVRAGVSP
ncbi:MAG: hypothetical protein QM756_35490 [Polyangiaceae bacterium]